eukprot:10721152-Lingulodinium_polyedra.AAC.1
MGRNPPAGLGRNTAWRSLANAGPRPKRSAASIMATRRCLSPFGSAKTHLGCSASRHNAARSAKAPQAASNSPTVRRRVGASAGRPRAAFEPLSTGAACQIRDHSLRAVSAAA